VFTIPWRLIAYGVAAAALLYAVVSVGQAIGNTIERARKYDATQKKLDSLENTYRQTVDRFTKAAADDSRVSAVLTGFGSMLDAQAAAFNQFVSSQPLMREAPNVDQKTGGAVVCRERDPRVFRLLYNAAVDGVVPAADAAGLPR
jgi:hypothetical protein